MVSESRYKFMLTWVVYKLAPLNQGDGAAADAFFAPGEAEAVGGGGLDALNQRLSAAGSE